MSWGLTHRAGAIASLFLALSLALAVSGCADSPRYTNSDGRP